jgi:MarR family transcriptional regulator, organic hydroperoxide resistance regulator
MPAAPARRQPGRARQRSANTRAIVAGLRRVVRALEVYSHEVRQSFGLTGPQLWALKTLEQRGPLTAGELAGELLVHQSSASLLVDRLERRGLVRRRRVPSDRRFVRIELSERGLTLSRSAPQAAQGRLLHGLAGMTPSRVRAIRRAVEDLVTAMEAEGLEARFFFEEG